MQLVKCPYTGRHRITPSPTLVNARTAWATASTVPLENISQSRWSVTPKRRRYQLMMES